MIEDERLRLRLGELARAHRSGAAAPAPERMPVLERAGDDARGTHALHGCPSPVLRPGPTAALLPGAPPGVGVEEFLPGGEWHDSPDHPGTPGAVYVHERLRSEIERPKPHWGRVGTPPAHEPELVELARLGLEQALFLDLETCGLASTTLFLAGTMHWNGGDFVLRQYFARHYGEEGPLLRALAEAMSGFEFLVTFNGKTFDVPFLLARAVVHGVRVGLPPRHLDLLHAARRRWRGELADCRLKTIEARVCRRWRAGDVPGDEIPGLYHDYVKRGDPYRLVPVFHHNLLDVVTMAEILRALCRSRDLETAASADS